MTTKTTKELIREARTLALCMDASMPDYGASRYAQRLLPELADALAELADREETGWEYSNRYGSLVQYPEHAIKRRRKAGEWEELRA